ncbi:MAG: rhomboid family intramembrane serine protease [Treponemataceae bacterium]|nr:rhomboid family intramembrane serine protease [Spirochaetales bacterium]MDY6031756.1 rhomboid family intramembrane serine protease [Treponemataceae bacterium]
MATSKKNKAGFSVSFDSPVGLVLVILLVVMAIIERLVPSIDWLFVCPCKAGNSAAFDYRNVADYFRILLYPFGFSSWNQLTANLVFILLLFPKIESVFGKLFSSMLVLITVAFAGVICVCFSNSVIYGTSGIVCMLLILAIFISADKRQIPLSYILLAVIYFAREIVSIIDTNTIEVFCHFAGSLAGSLVGILSLSFGGKVR